MAPPAWVHPRGYGEQNSAGLDDVRIVGPSLQVQGAGKVAIRPVHLPGAIPASAGSSPSGPRTRESAGDHPRGCGEQSASSFRLTSRTGPSPRVRGAVEPELGAHLLLGTIPAGAGSSQSDSSSLFTLRDHPRGCGEQMTSKGDDVQVWGPSPRVRGAVPLALVAPRGRGTIPAGAGSSRRLGGRSPRSGDHPRGCGEQISRARPSPTTLGPSPRVRGAGQRRPAFLPAAGTIPAGAGSRYRGPGPRPRRWDHPRGCGEQRAAEGIHDARQGPSPRVRGAEPPGFLQPPVAGTIPAGAGSRSCRGAASAGGRDHPRGCGEQAATARAGSTCGGPSPRVRGADRAPTRSANFPGTIPAGAGSRSRRPAGRATCRDHPRGCGEQVAFIQGVKAGEGPSPRVRGAVPGRIDAAGAVGTIPAGAGSSSEPSPTAAPPEDHPRGCGEQLRHVHEPGEVEGPSPRVRGAGRCDRLAAGRRGTIPAGAGSSHVASIGIRPTRDHPRGCGEQRPAPGCQMITPGPSPRVRGAEPETGGAGEGLGTIPAGAGSSAG